MKSITYKKRVNQGWNNYPSEVNIKVDDKLYEVLSVIQGGGKLDNSQPDGCMYFQKMGVMSQDSGFCWIDLDSKTYGQGIGMFYGGIPKGSEYLDLNMLNTEGEYKYSDVVKVK